MNITDKDYQKWLNMSMIICNNKEIAEDILQELLLHLLEKNNDHINVIDSYIFISLRNRYLNYLSKNKNKYEEISDIEDPFTLEETDVLIEKELEDSKKIQSITETILALPSYDMKLYQLHFIWGLSQREIAKRIGISHMTINMRVNKIKDKIRENYGKK